MRLPVLVTSRVLANVAIQGDFPVVPTVSLAPPFRVVVVLRFADEPSVTGQPMCGALATWNDWRQIFPGYPLPATLSAPAAARGVAGV